MSIYSLFSNVLNYVMFNQKFIDIIKLISVDWYFMSSCL